jgi:hypothetical protein
MTVKKCSLRFHAIAKSSQIGLVMRLRFQWNRFTLGRFPTGLHKLGTGWGRFK